MIVRGNGGKADVTGKGSGGKGSGDITGVGGNESPSKFGGNNVFVLCRVRLRVLTGGYEVSPGEERTGRSGMLSGEETFELAVSHDKNAHDPEIFPSNLKLSDGEGGNGVISSARELDLALMRETNMPDEVPPDVRRRFGEESSAKPTDSAVAKPESSVVLIG